MAKDTVAAHKKGALKSGRSIVFIDETGFMLQPVVRATWAPRGSTPVLKSWDRRDRLTALSALTVSARRLEIHYTPKHGSWLNIAELELSALTRQCLNQRTPDIKTLRRQTQSWTQQRNTKQRGVDWQFSTPDARIKLRRLYPEIQC